MLERSDPSGGELGVSEGDLGASWGDLGAIWGAQGGRDGKGVGGRQLQGGPL